MFGLLRTRILADFRLSEAVSFRWFSGSGFLVTFLIMGFGFGV